MYQTDCTGCGLSVHDLPDELGDRELVREQFFDFDDGGDLYCNGWARIETPRRTRYHAFVGPAEVAK